MKKSFISLLLFFAGCVYGPETEHKSALNYLNGENYDNMADGKSSSVVIPVVKTKERSSSVTGVVNYASGIAQVPLRNQEVSLCNSSGTAVQTVATDNNGEFKFTGEFKNGDYTIKLPLGHYVGQAPVEIKSYQTSGIIILAKASTD